MNRNELNPRYVIHFEPTKWPYGSKLSLFLNGERSFKIEGATCFSVDDNYIVRFEPGSKLSVQNEIKNPEFQVWNIYIEGFKSACEAEKTGIRFAASLLWSAISKNYPVRLIYNTPFPCVVYNRNASNGFSMEAYGHSNYPEDITSTVEGLKAMFCSAIEIDPKWFLSMELFAAYPLEITQRAKFIMLMTAVEALAEQKYYGEKVSGIIEEFRKQITANGSIDDNVRSSILSRLGWLDIEAISHSIRRLIREHLSGDKAAEETIVNAYDIRSRLLHDGSTDADIEEYSRKVGEIMKRVFASHFKLLLQ